MAFVGTISHVHLDSRRIKDPESKHIYTVFFMNVQIYPSLHPAQYHNLKKYLVELRRGMVSRDWNNTLLTSVKTNNKKEALRIFNGINLTTIHTIESEIREIESLKKNIKDIERSISHDLYHGGMNWSEKKKLWPCFNIALHMRPGQESGHL